MVVSRAEVASPAVVPSTSGVPARYSVYETSGLPGDPVRVMAGGCQVTSTHPVSSAVARTPVGAYSAGSRGGVRLGAGETGAGETGAGDPGPGRPDPGRPDWPPPGWPPPGWPPPRRGFAGGLSRGCRGRLAAVGAPVASGDAPAGSPSGCVPGSRTGRFAS